MLEKYLHINFFSNSASSLASCSFGSFIPRTCLILFQKNSERISVVLNGVIILVIFLDVVAKIAGGFCWILCEYLECSKRVAQIRVAPPGKVTTLRMNEFLMSVFMVV